MGFFLALQFLTTIALPFKLKSNQKKLSAATLYFPLIGLLLGLILAAANNFLNFLSIGPLAASVILVTLLIILTGGLHLDGLADTFDALFSRKSSPEMLEVMRDSHIGTMGMLSLVCVILLKISLLYSLPAPAVNLALISMCLLSRYAIVAAIFLFPYAREQGKAKIFFSGINWQIFALASLVSLAYVLAFLKLKGLIIFILVFLFVLFVGKLISKKINGLTGDTLGALNELAEVFALFNILIWSRLNI